MTQERLKRASITCFVLAALLLLAHAACSETLLLVGYGATHNLGERPGFEVTASTSGRYFLVSSDWFTADKVETGRGWGTHLSAEARWKVVGLGFSYSYRSGGEWEKHYPWVRASLHFGPLTLTGEQSLGGWNHERKVEIRTTGHIGRRFTMQSRGFLESHLQGTAVGAAVLFGVAFGGDR